MVPKVETSEAAILPELTTGAEKIPKKHTEELHVSFFANHLVAAEYHEQKSTGYIKTGLFKSCLWAK